MLTRNTIASIGKVDPLGCVDLFRTIDLDGAGQQGIVSFRATIGNLVVQDVSAEYRHGGKMLGNISGFTDVCLAETFMVTSSLGRDVSRFLREFAVTQESSLAVVVEARQTIVPVVVAYEDGRSPIAPADSQSVFGRTVYMLVPEDWSINRTSLEKLNAFQTHRGPGPRPDWPADDGAFLRQFIRNHAEIWRSDMGAGDNQALLASYLERISTPFPTPDYAAPENVGLLPAPGI